MRGIAAMLLAVALFAFMDAMMKHLVGNYPPMQVASMRGFASLPFVLLPIVLRGTYRRLVPVRWSLHLLRGVLGVIMLWAFVYSVRELSLADTYSIFLCAPLVVTALSVPLLRKRVDSRRWIAIGVGFAEVLVMLGPCRTVVARQTAALVVNHLLLAGHDLGARARGPTPPGQCSGSCSCSRSVRACSRLLVGGGAPGDGRGSRASA
jgi:hypothetical protein